MFLYVLLFAPVIAGWAAVFATIGAAAVNRWFEWDARARLVAGCAAAGATVGAAFPIAVVASFAGRAAIEHSFWIGLYVPGLIAGALCGGLLPRIAFRPRPLG